MADGGGQTSFEFAFWNLTLIGRPSTIMPFPLQTALEAASGNSLSIRHEPLNFPVFRSFNHKTCVTPGKAFKEFLLAHSIPTKVG
jgi:hypothetical protein